MKTTDAIALLKEDHKKVKGLFDQFEKTDDNGKKEKIVADVIKELKIHATIEEEIFYPALREVFQTEKKAEELTELMNEADEEHRVAKTVIEALEDLDPSDEHYCAKFTVLAENVRHHIKEEEGDIFKEAKDTDVDMKELGDRMSVCKMELMGNEAAIKEAEENSDVKPYQELSRN
jgi:hemerythrin superfamily protein